MEPELQQLKADMAGEYTIRYCMSGLIESWDSYNDTLHAVSKPIQMGPLWVQASQMTGQVMASNIWVKDPPASSYLACVAAKCAFMQSQDCGERFLFALRQALMTQELNIAKLSNILAVAQSVSEEIGLDLERFQTELVDGSGMAAFREDLQEVRYKNISRFPSLLISCGTKSLLLTGYRKYPSLAEAITKVRETDPATV